MARVLVIVEETSLREAVCSFLALQGHTIAVAGGGSEALEILAGTECSLAIVDIAPPDMDFAWVKSLRQRVSIIAISGFAFAASEAGELATAEKPGSSEKPFSLSELLGCIDSWLRQSTTMAEPSTTGSGR
jgi:DNA-binding response OmpR family regulator